MSVCMSMCVYWGWVGRTCETTCFHHPLILSVVQCSEKVPEGIVGLIFRSTNTYNITRRGLCFPPRINHSLMGFNTSQTPPHCASLRNASPHFPFRGRLCHPYCQSRTVFCPNVNVLCTEKFGNFHPKTLVKNIRKARLCH